MPERHDATLVTPSGVADEDDLVRQWSQVVPEIDPDVEGVVDRVLMAARYLERLAASLAESAGLQASDYEILARLFWTGPPFRLRPTQLAAGTDTALTTITSRLDRLCRNGLVVRVADRTDGRSRAAQLTEAGRAAFVGIVRRQAGIEQQAVRRVADQELSDLTALLQKLLAGFESQFGPPPRRISLATGE